MYSLFCFTAVVLNIVTQFLNMLYIHTTMDFRRTGVEYENIVKLLLYGCVDEGRTSHLYKQTGDTLNY